MLKLTNRTMLRRWQRGTAAVVAVIAGIACNAALAATSPGQRERVETLAPLLTSAAAFGEAYGVLVGPAADAIAGQFASREPILVDVKAVSALPTPGCWRLHVDTRQEQVVDRERAAQPGVAGAQRPAGPMRLQYHVSYCANGTFAPPAGGTAARTSPAKAAEVGR